MSSTPPHSVDLILTDPPYGLVSILKDRKTSNCSIREDYIRHQDWDDIKEFQLGDLLDGFFKSAKRVLKDTGQMIVFTSFTYAGLVEELGMKNGFHHKCFGVWHKTNPIPLNMDKRFLSSCECFVHFTNKTRTSTFNNNKKALHNHIEMPITSRSEKKHGKHAAQKPVALMEYFIKTLTNEGDTVMDPFMGSGTTGVAAKKLNRNFVGVELEKEYFDLSVTRIDEAERVVL